VDHYTVEPHRRGGQFGCGVDALGLVFLYAPYLSVLLTFMGSSVGLERPGLCA